MTKSQRKRHLQIWLLWAILIPVGIIVAWMAVPRKVTQDLLQPEKSDVLVQVLESVIKENKYTVSLRKDDSEPKYQLEWIQISKIDNPSFLIYQIGETESELIGRVGRRAIYYFNLPQKTTGSHKFIIYDIIKKEVIDSINFNR